MKRIMALGGVATALILSGCAGRWDVDGVEKMTPPPGEFVRALHEAYVERAKFERDEADWPDTAFFVDRARSAANGVIPTPQTPADRGLKGDTAQRMAAARERLLAALATDAPTKAPVPCAQAQGWYEHWLEQEQEGHQPDHIALARKEFIDNVGQCERAAEVAEPAPKPTPPPAVLSYEVYFGFDSAALDDPDRAAIADAANSFKKMDEATITLTAHTDTKGSAAYNRNLAQRRAQAVKNQLVVYGVPADRVDIYALGETNLPVMTKDGVREPRNRRVGITVKRLR